jgi:hypothetical protein
MGKKVTLKTIGMSCNVEDPFQKELYEYVKGKSNSSSYLKSVVIREMLGDPQPKMAQTESFESEIASDVSSFV